MQRIISATRARIHFGKIMKQAQAGPVIVERGGKAEVVVISKKTYDRLTSADMGTALQKKLDELHARIRAELAERAAPDPIDVIQTGREERDGEMADMRLVNTLKPYKLNWVRGIE